MAMSVGNSCAPPIYTNIGESGMVGFANIHYPPAEYGTVGQISGEQIFYIRLPP